MSLVYLGLGSNLGDRLANLAAAREKIGTRLKILRASSVYETPPWGYLEQPAFLNQVLKCRTALDPIALLRFLKDSESQMGRQANFRNGPRLIDMDILFYGKQILKSEALQIPHPRLHERAFVLVPLAEIAPHFVHPLLRRRVSSLLKDLQETDGVRKCA